MPPVTNPFASDPDKAQVFELGYLAGFHDPAGNDSTFVPLAPEFLDVYIEGAEAGRADAHAPPPADASKRWVAKSELRGDSEDSTAEAIEHVTSLAFFLALEHISKQALFGLVDLLILTIGIQGNVTPEQLRPLDDDFEEPYNGPEDENVFYVAMCPRKDHSLVLRGATSQGTWAALPHHDFKEALLEAVEHPHRESFVARCDLNSNQCGSVWLAKDGP
jgi:hypothetical protein